MKLNRLSILLSFFILGCTTTAEIEGLPEMDKETTIRFNQYYRDGRLLYVNYCSSCHMESGEGLKNVIPSLVESPTFRNAMEEVPCKIKYGSEKHQSSAPGMVGFRALSDLEIAEITTYISSSWGNKVGLMPVKRVKTLLDSCNVDQ